MSPHRSTVIVSVLVAAGLAACTPDRIASPPANVDASSTTLRSAVRARAFTLDFDLRAGSVRVSAPVAAPLGDRTSAIALGTASLGVTPRTMLSLLGMGVVDLELSNYGAGAIGASVAGRVRITADLRLVNLLDLNLVAPTFPPPPAGVPGIQAFPFEITAVEVEGGPFLPSPPGTGPVQPSDDWSGAPHNFLNDVACGLPNSDCFRYEPFASVPARGVSEAGSIGFLVEPTVRQFRVTIVLAADLQAPPAP